MDIPGARQFLLRFFTVIGVVLSRISWSLQQLNSITSLWSLKIAPQLHVIVLASLQAHCLVWTFKGNKNDNILYLNVCCTTWDALTWKEGLDKPLPWTETLYHYLLFSSFPCILYVSPFPIRFFASSFLTNLTSNPSLFGQEFIGNNSKSSNNDNDNNDDDDDDDVDDNNNNETNNNNNDNNDDDNCYKDDAYNFFYIAG